MVVRMKVSMVRHPTYTSFAISRPFKSGLFVPLFAYSISHVYKSNSTSPSRWVIFGLTILTFILTTIYWILYFVWFILYIHHALLLDNDTGRLDISTAQMTFSSRVFEVYKLAGWIRQILQIAGDMIVFWRAQVL